MQQLKALADHLGIGKSEGVEQRMQHSLLVQLVAVSRALLGHVTQHCQNLEREMVGVSQVAWLSN